MAESRSFETNVQAFEFACEHLDCSLDAGKAVLAIVLAVQGRMCSVKIANRDDHSIPVGTMNELLAQPDLAHVCFSAMLADKVPAVAPGDLVTYTAMPELAAIGKPTLAGTIVAKVTPHYTARGGWQVRAPEPKVPRPPKESETAESAAPSDPA